jgi:hypothetical protein
MCLIDQPQLIPRLDVLAGRAMQSAWLALTAVGVSVQPMMSLVVLDNLYHHNVVPRSMNSAQVSDLLAAFRAAAPELGTARPAFLLRFGYAKPPTVRTGRLKLESNTTILGSSAVNLAHRKKVS